MANTDNQCFNLPVEHIESPDWDKVFEMQLSLQKRIMGPDFDSQDNSLQNVADFFIKNKHALEDELSETIDAIGGIHDGIGSAAWKWWKKDNDFADSATLRNLSERDRLELAFEIVDQMHFLINQFVKLGITGSQAYSLYMSKNAENFNRQENGY